MAANRNGWYIKVCRPETKAGRIVIDVGIIGRVETRRQVRQWYQSEDVEFDVPDPYQTVSEIYLKATSIPKGQPVHLCICYRDHVVRQMNFDDFVEYELSQAEYDSCDC